MKVADITIGDDGEGSNGLALSGDDAALFEIFGGDLYLKAGTVLDYESGNTKLDVTVEVNDPAVDGTPDDFEALSISVTDVNAAPTLALAGTTTSLAENTDTSSRVKVADITIGDDGVGTQWADAVGGRCGAVRDRRAVSCTSRPAPCWTTRAATPSLTSR